MHMVNFNMALSLDLLGNGIVMGLPDKWDDFSEAQLLFDITPRYGSPSSSSLSLSDMADLGKKFFVFFIQLKSLLWNAEIFRINTIMTISNYTSIV